MSPRALWVAVLAGGLLAVAGALLPWIGFHVSGGFFSESLSFSFQTTGVAHWTGLVALAAGVVTVAVGLVGLLTRRRLAEIALLAGLVALVGSAYVVFNPGRVLDHFEEPRDFAANLGFEERAGVSHFLEGWERLQRETAVLDEELPLSVDAGPRVGVYLSLVGSGVASVASIILLRRRG